MSSSRNIYEVEEVVVSRHIYHVPADSPQDALDILDAAEEGGEDLLLLESYDFYEMTPKVSHMVEAEVDCS